MNAGGSPTESPVLPPLEAAALLLAALGSIGSVFLSVGMGLNACPLCFYQRTFIFGVLGVLTAARLARGAFAPGAACLLAAPLSLAGLAVAAFHVSMEARGILECPRGVLGLGSSPLQSLLVFVLICAAVIPAAVIRTRTMARRFLVLAGGCV
ncbi:MAG TPA: disulfide bond formation protein B, partial [Planctomycetota bacterium]|nr:disulfide bond formation protein B [Planctomycetota bacterium]